MMIQRRCGTILFRIVITPSRVSAVMIILLISSLILSEIFSEKDDGLLEFAQYDKKIPVFRHQGIKKNSEDVNKGKEKSDCPIFKLNTTSEEQSNSNSRVTCKRLRPVSGSCDKAREIFEFDNPASCSFQKHYEFCRLQKTESNLWIVLCDSKVAEICISSLSLGLTNQKTGRLEWEDHLDVVLLGEKLTKIIQVSDSSLASQHYGFAFIHCEKKAEDYVQYEYYHDYYNHAEQLLILPPSTGNLKLKPEKPSNFHDLNLNIILVDSLSRQHLFRSLPKTVSMIENISSNSDANVFDFELFQAIKSRTFETLQAVFSGTVNVTETPFGIYEMPSRPLNLAPIFKPLENRGYKTLWLEDLCYLWEWGISKDLHFLKADSKPEDTWKRMWLALEKSGVESIDTTLSMCRVLEANGVNDHFHGPEAVCFNGKHQHEYLLDYLKLYQEEMKTWNQPYLTMTSTNVGHEETGRRIQTLDKALADYLAFTPSLGNTISIVFSDHGNAYGKFFKASNEALVELYQPFLFFIVPHLAADLLGKEMMDSLRLNTKRLVTALDLHYSLFHIVSVDSKGLSQAPEQQYPVSEKGLFHPVSPERTCNYLPRIHPNVCICENFSIELDPSSFAPLLGYFAVGAINDEIQRQYRKSLARSSQTEAFGNCQPLYLDKVTEIRQTTRSDEERLFQMNIHIQKSQVFFISIVMTKNAQGEPHTFLETVTRITPYSIYKNCSDTSVELELCICNITQPNEISNYTKNLHPGQNHFERFKMNELQFLEKTVKPLKTNPCLQLFSLNHKDGVVVFAVNECKTIYILNVKIESQRNFIYFQRTEEFLSLPGGVVLLGLVVSEGGNPWSCSVATDFRVMKH